MFFIIINKQTLNIKNCIEIGTNYQMKGLNVLKINK